MDDVNKNAQIVWDYMHLNDKIVRSDAILVLGSHDTRVAERAAQLFLEGYSDTLIISGGVGQVTKSGFSEPEAEVFKTITIRAGVPEDKIIIEDRSTNTGEDILFTYKMLQKLGKHFKSLIVVQKPYMERRTYATFKKQWPDKEAIIILASPELTYGEYFAMSPIPMSNAISIMVGDLQRIREYPKLGFQIEQDIPKEVWEAYEALVREGFVQHLI
jgi:uncharacterized SAM-binding protein YcdF (DUF218 family)